MTQALSSSGTANRIEDITEDEIDNGNVYQVHRRFTIPSAGKKLVLDLSAVTDRSIFTMPILMGTNEGQCYVDTYKITSYTGGTAIPSINKNGTSSNTAQGIFYEDVTSSDVAGDDLRQYIVGQLSSNQNTGGGPGGETYKKVFNSDIIMLDVTNNEGTDIVLELNWSWGEVPND